MNITVENGSEELRFIAQFMAEFCAKELGISHLERNVIIGFIPGLRKECAGFTHSIGNTIAVGLDASMEITKILLTLAHEMVHVGQISRNELKVEYDSGIPVKYWKGISVKVAYANEPWEIEAYALESILFEKFLKKVI